MRLSAIIIYFLISITRAVPLTVASEPNSSVSGNGCGHHLTLFEVLTKTLQPAVQPNNATSNRIEEYGLQMANSGYIASAEAKFGRWYGSLESTMNIVISSHATYFCLIALVCVLMGVLVSKEMLIRRRRRKIVAALLEKATRKEGLQKKSMYLKERLIV